MSLHVNADGTKAQAGGITITGMGAPTEWTALVLCRHEPRSSGFRTMLEMRLGPAGSDRAILQLNGSQFVAFFWTGSGATASSGALVEGDWYAAAITCPASGTILPWAWPVNGVPVSFAGTAAMADRSAQTLWVGASQQFPTEASDGQYRACRVWPRALTAAELEAEGKSLAAVAAGALVDAPMQALATGTVNLGSAGVVAYGSKAPVESALEPTISGGPAAVTGTAAFATSIGAAGVGSPVAQGSSAFLATFAVAAAGAPVVAGAAAFGLAFGLSASGSAVSGVSGALAAVASFGLSAQGSPIISGALSASLAPVLAAIGAPVVRGAGAASLALTTAAQGAPVVRGVAAFGTAGPTMIAGPAYVAPLLGGARLLPAAPNWTARPVGEGWTARAADSAGLTARPTPST